jgi:putative copper resistance protein D
MGTGSDVHLVSDIVHLATASVWVGGLLPLLIFVRPGRELTALGRYQIVRRFSTLAVWSVALLAVSGLANTWFMTDGLQHLFGTEYGDLVLIKIGLFIAMLGFAGVNRFRLTPRLAKSAGTPSDDNAPRLLCWSTAAEIALGFLVICVVAVLGGTEPPGHQHAAQAFPDQLALRGTLNRTF